MLRVLLLLSWLAPLQAVAGPERMDEVASLLAERALEAPTAQTLAAIRSDDWEAALAEFDPHARLIDSDRDAEKGPGMAGIGATIRADAAGDLWLLAQQGGPAEQAGLLGPVRLLAVDGQPVSAVDAARVAEWIRGRAGSTVLIEVGDALGESRRYRLTRAAFEPLAVERRESPVGTVLRIGPFRGGVTRPAVEELLLRHKRAGGGALVLDLRFSGGGDVFEALDVARLFLPAGKTLARFVDRAGDAQVFVSRTDGPGRALPLTVWVSGETASAAEILAGILRFHGRAPLLGESTWGKCSIQTEQPLSDGSLLRFTERRVLFPDGSSCDGHPLSPDGPLPVRQ
ncbi:MAG: S41 family peptidase [Halothiobacillaceae bacterium]